MWRQNDPYEFFVFKTKDGELLIRAGCRTMLAEEYKAHAEKEYPDTPKFREMMALIAYAATSAKGF